MTYLRTFIPWIVLAVVSAFADWRAAMAAALVASVLVLSEQGRAARSDLLGLATLGYFAVMTVVALILPHAGLRHYTAALSLAVLGAVAWVSLALRRPFTLHFARQQTSRELWDQPAFYRINAVITAVWAACFVLSAAACTAAVALISKPSTVVVVCEVIGFAVPAIFTSRYPTYAAGRS
ncbi:MAG: hypothetical protein J2O48_11730 [Solirubrobacterales bacterium]|nr:hypothetical protein [Solirubrobacterales bacterium]